MQFTGRVEGASAVAVVGLLFVFHSWDDLV